MINKIFILIKSFFIKIFLLKNVRIAFSSRLKVYRAVRMKFQPNSIVMFNSNIIFQDNSTFRSWQKFMYFSKF